MKAHPKAARSEVDNGRIIVGDNNRSDGGGGRTKAVERQLEKKTLKERTRRDKINTSILQLKQIIRESVNLVSVSSSEYIVF